MPAPMRAVATGGCFNSLQAIPAPMAKAALGLAAARAFRSSNIRVKNDCAFDFKSAHETSDRFVANAETLNPWRVWLGPPQLQAPEWRGSRSFTYSTRRRLPVGPEALLALRSLQAVAAESLPSVGSSPGCCLLDA